MQGKPGVIRYSLEMLRMLLGKAAAQLLGLCMLLLGLGLLVFINCGALQQVADRSTGLRVSIHARLPPAIVQALNATVAPAAAAAPVAVVPPTPIVPEPLSSSVEELFGLSEEEGEAATIVTAATVVVKAAAAASGAADPRALWLFLGQYVGWWASLVWCVYAYCSMAVYRTGMNVA